MRAARGMCGVVLMLLGSAVAATAQEGESAPLPCPRDRNISVQGVRVARWDPSMGPRSQTPVAIDTIVLPTDSALLYVTARVNVGVAQPGDSIYGVETLELLLRSAPSTRDSAGAIVVLPSMRARDTLVSLSRQTYLTFGPIAGGLVDPLA
jgi:hypothetical protein